MKKTMKHKGRLAKRCMVLFLTLTVMLMLLVPPVWAPPGGDDKPGGSGGGKGGSFWIYRLFGSNETNESQDQVIAMRTNSPGGAGPFMPENSRWLGNNDTNKTEPFLISPTGTGDKPGDSGGGSKYWPWVYRLFGSNDTNDYLIAGEPTKSGGGSGTRGLKIYRLFG